MRPLVAAFMYIIVGKEFEQFSQETVVHDFPTCSIYMLGQEYAFNSLFGKFMEVFFGMALEELLPFIQYAATFISLEPNFNFPSIADDNRNETLSVGCVSNSGIFRGFPRLPNPPSFFPQLYTPKKTFKNELLIILLPTVLNYSQFFIINNINKS